MAAAAGGLSWPGTWSARASRCASTAGRVPRGWRPWCVTTLPESVRLTHSLAEALERDTVVISVGAQGLRGLLREIAALCPGGEGKRLRLTHSWWTGAAAGNRRPVPRRGGQAPGAVHEGPGGRHGQAPDHLGGGGAAPGPGGGVAGAGHVQEFTAGIPNCMVIDSKDEALKEELVAAFSSELIRFYYGRDLIGNEIGGASKNVIGIAAGMLDGLGLSSLKGALMSRGTREIARLIKALGGNELSAYGLCHLGDYEATVFSPYSHNRRFGEAFVTGEPYGELAEGYATVKALVKLGEDRWVALPICQAVYQVLYQGADPRATLDGLFSRSLKQEF